MRPKENSLKQEINTIVGQFKCLSAGVMRKGFTLIELLIVVLIIGILASWALPKYELAVYEARFTKTQTFVNSLVQAQEVYYMANGVYSKNLAELDIAYPSSCKYSQTSQTNNWGYDQLDCPDFRLHLDVDYDGIGAYVKKCPVSGGYCAIYMVPYKNARHSLMGKGPSCRPYTSTSEKVTAFGERVCLSLGGKKETNRWGDFYYL